MTIAPHPLLPSGAATTITRLLSRTRSDLCVISRSPSTVDAGGAVITGPYTVVEGVPCRVRAAGRTPVEGISGGRFAPVADYEIFLPPDTDVVSNDRIVANGHVMEVVDDRDAISHGFELMVLVKATT